MEIKTVDHKEDGANAVKSIRCECQQLESHGCSTVKRLEMYRLSSRR
jgi:hypothetical protein